MKTQTRKQRYSCSTISFTSALDGVGGQRHAPGRFNPKKETRYPLYGRQGKPQGRCKRVRKISPPPEFEARTLQAVRGRYTHYANPVQHGHVAVLIRQSQEKIQRSPKLGILPWSPEKHSDENVAADGFT